MLCIYCHSNDDSITKWQLVLRITTTAAAAAAAAAAG